MLQTRRSELPALQDPDVGHAPHATIFTSKKSNQNSSLWIRPPPSLLFQPTIVRLKRYYNSLFIKIKLRVQFGVLLLLMWRIRTWVHAARASRFCTLPMCVPSSQAVLWCSVPYCCHFCTARTPLIKKVRILIPLAKSLLLIREAKPQDGSLKYSKLRVLFFLCKANSAA